MTQDNTLISFVGQKLSKIRWSQERDGSLSKHHFITGSWDDDQSLLCQWHISEDSTEESGANLEPYMTSSISVYGSVTDLVVVNSKTILCSTSTGDVCMVGIDDYNNEMNFIQKWQKLHMYRSTKEAACCTCVAVNDQEIVTGGEDGCLNVLDFQHKRPVRVFPHADSSNITALQFLNATEVASVNTTGQLKVWDMRHQQDTPRKVLTLPGNACPILSMDKHPNQPHILVTGHGDGVVGIWDIRQDKSPVTLIDAHKSEVWQVKFHPLYPDNLFTCSQEGTCWFWDGTAMMTGADYIKTLTDTTQNIFDITSSKVDDSAVSSSVWLHVDANKHKMETYSLIPFNLNSVNCFDVNRSSLICGTDQEALIIVNDIPVR